METLQFWQTFITQPCTLPALLFAAMGLACVFIYTRRDKVVPAPRWVGVFVLVAAGTFLVQAAGNILWAVVASLSPEKISTVWRVAMIAVSGFGAVVCWAMWLVATSATIKYVMPIAIRKGRRWLFERLANERIVSLELAHARDALFGRKHTGASQGTSHQQATAMATHRYWRQWEFPRIITWLYIYLVWFMLPVPVLFLAMAGGNIAIFIGLLVTPDLKIAESTTTAVMLMLSCPIYFFAVILMILYGYYAMRDYSRIAGKVYMRRKKG